MTTIRETIKRAGPWPRDPRAPKGGTPNYADGSQEKHGSWEPSADDYAALYIDPRYLDDNAENSQ